MIARLLVDWSSQFDVVPDAEPNQQQSHDMVDEDEAPLQPRYTTRHRRVDVSEFVDSDAELEDDIEQQQQPMMVHIPAFAPSSQPIKIETQQQHSPAKFFDAFGTGSPQMSPRFNSTMFSSDFGTPFLSSMSGPEMPSFPSMASRSLFHSESPPY